MGIPRDVAKTLAAQTFFGSAKLLIEQGDHPGVLKDMTTSQGGTTIHALHELEKLGYRNCLISAVEAACERSIELAKK